MSEFSYEVENIKSKIPFLLFIIILTIFSICSLFLLSFLYTEYHVWSNSMDGKAELAKADYNRQISVREAIAKRDAAIELAKAEIERAKGVAQANKIIGDSLKGNEEYLHYLWIDNLQNSNNKVIYIPTEANLPILESSRKS